MGIGLIVGALAIEGWVSTLGLFPTLKRRFRLLPARLDVVTALNRIVAVVVEADPCNALVIIEPYRDCSFEMLVTLCCGHSIGFTCQG